MIPASMAAALTLGNSFLAIIFFLPFCLQLPFSFSITLQALLAVLAAHITRLSFHCCGSRGEVLRAAAFVFAPLDHVIEDEAGLRRRLVRFHNKCEKE